MIKSNKSRFLTVQCHYFFFSSFSGGSLKISLTFFKVRFLITTGFDIRPFIFRFFMFVSFIVIIFVLVFFSGMLPLYFPVSFKVRFLVIRGFGLVLFILRLFMRIFFTLTTFIFSSSSGIFYPSPFRTVFFSFRTVFL